MVRREACGEHIAEFGAAQAVGGKWRMTCEVDLAEGEGGDRGGAVVAAASAWRG